MADKGNPIRELISYAVTSAAISLLAVFVYAGVPSNTFSIPIPRWIIAIGAIIVVLYTSGLSSPHRRSTILVEWFFDRLKKIITYVMSVSSKLESKSDMTISKKSVDQVPYTPPLHETETIVRKEQSPIGLSGSILGVFKSLRSFSPTVLLYTHNILRLWHVGLFKPVQFGYLQYQIYAQKRYWGIVETAIKMSMLLLLNTLIMCLIMLFQANNDFSFWAQLFWLWFFPTILMAYFPREMRDDTEKFPDYFFLTGFTWLFIVLAWIGPARGWAEFLGLRILVNTFIIGLALRFMFSSIFAGNGGKLGFYAVLIIGIGGAFFTSPDSFIAAPEADPILTPIVHKFENTYNESLQSAPVTPSESATDEIPDSDNDEANNEVQPVPVEGEEAPSSLMLLSVRGAIGVVAFVGSSVGLVVGWPSLFILILEAPFFYLAWLFVILGRDPIGLKWLKEVASFDEWRDKGWWGEDKFYNWLQKKDPDEFLSLLAPQIFYTARDDTAAKYLIGFIDSLKPEDIVEKLLPLLPYEEYEKDEQKMPTYPTISCLASLSKKHVVFENILKYRRSFLTDGIVSFKKKIRLQNKKIQNYDLLCSFAILAKADWQNIDCEKGRAKKDCEKELAGKDRDEEQVQKDRDEEQVQKDCGKKLADSIRSGFDNNRDLPNIKVIYKLAIATKEALIINECQQINELGKYWQDLGAAIPDAPHDYDYLQSYTQLFIDSAEIVADLDPTNKENICNAALHFFELRNALAELDAEKRQVGVGPVRLVIKHWEKLLGECLQSKVRPNNPLAHELESNAVIEGSKPEK